MSHVNSADSQFLFYSIIATQSPPKSVAWLDEKTERLRKKFSEKEFYLTFSLLPRFYGKEKINLSGEQAKKAHSIKAGFNPADFTLVQCARIFMVLLIPQGDEKRFHTILNNLFSTGEVNELVALYSALPLLPFPESLKSRAAEGVRSNMTVVFDAIALNNPYPAEHLDDDAWNQMVLKAVFVERPLDKIYGIDKRVNGKLAKMLSDYAHERWAASRYVTPELWRPVGPCIDEQLLKDMERLLEQGIELDKQAAALAIQSSNFLKAKNLLPENLKQGMEENEFNWHTIAEKWDETRLANSIIR